MSLSPSSIIATLQRTAESIYSLCRPTRIVSVDCWKKQQQAAELLGSTKDLFHQGATSSSEWMAELSGREKDILRLVAAGLIDKHIASELDISLNTLRTYWSRIRKKSGHMTRVALVLAFVQWESVPTDSEKVRLPSLSMLHGISDPDASSRAAAYYALALQSVQDAMRNAYHLARVLSSYPNVGAATMSEPALAKSVCKTLVEDGSYKMAWVGLARDDDAKSVHSAASAGDVNGYLTQAAMSWGDNRFGHGPTGSAIRTGQVQVNQDFETNAQVAPWKELALRHGFQSSIAVPLKVDAEAFGVLCVYSNSRNSFQEPEIRVLELIAADVAIRILQFRRGS